MATYHSIALDHWWLFHMSYQQLIAFMIIQACGACLALPKRIQIGIRIFSQKKNLSEIQSLLGTFQSAKFLSWTWATRHNPDYRRLGRLLFGTKDPREPLNPMEIQDRSRSIKDVYYHDNYQKGRAYYDIGTRSISNIHCYTLELPSTSVAAMC